MSLDIAGASLPVFRRTLTALHGVLLKAQAHCEAHGIDPLVLTASRLYPDMLPLTSQVWIACDMAKGAAARLAGFEPPAFPDTEKSLVELADRVQRTLAYLDTVKPEALAGSETREIVLRLRTRTLEFSGQDYLLHFVLPNLFFHATTTYAILRHNGVVLGKVDFLGG